MEGIRRCKSLVPLLILIVLYSAIAFVNLGNTQSPQSTWSSIEAVTIDFGEVRYISRFQFMVGARHDIDFMLFTSEDAYNWAYELHVHSMEVFRWEERHIGYYARYIQIIPFSYGLRLQEIAFRDEHDNLIRNLRIIASEPEAFALIDEQHLVPSGYGFMNSTYFDEIYHARTAYEFIHGLPVFETTHPPMGKNFISLGIRAFGMTPFGWRFAGTITGILMIPLMYLFGRIMFQSNFWGFMAAFIFAFDFMTFAQTRIATIDSYVVFFIMASYLFMYIYYRYAKHMTLTPSLICLLGSAICIAFAIATKWQGLYAAIGLPIMFFPAWLNVYKISKKNAWLTFTACFPIFIAIPILIYALSYIPFVNAMDTGDGFIQTVLYNQVHMFTYHSDLIADHPFGSRWWEWPLIIRPIFYYVNHLPNGMHQGISSFGNPAVWWTGIAATFTVAIAWVRKKLNKRDYQIVSFLLIAYAMQILPWIFVYRLTFIYHYFPSVPFVILIIVFCLKNYVWTKYPKIVLIYGSVVYGLFMLFYPVLSGLPVSVEFANTFLRWLPAWVLI